MRRQADTDTPTRRLKVTACEPFRSFTDRRSGRERHVYRVRAEGEDGKPVSARLRAFDRLPVDGQLREYRVRPDPHPQYGTTYVLSLAGGLTGRVEGLERTVGALGQRIRRLEGAPHQPPSIGGSIGAAATSPERAP